jgi:hypothetical protein
VNRSYALSLGTVITVFLDETGIFRPCLAGEDELSAVIGLIIPEIDSQALKQDFSAFVAKLPRGVFVNGEPKGNRFSMEQHKEVALLLNARPGIMSVPVTFNRAMSTSSFDSWPASLKELLTKEASMCVHETMRQQVQELARRCGNLSSDQISRLLTYKIAVEKALAGICLFYHCAKYHSSYAPIKIVFDRTGPPGGREELVFKEMMFIWVTKNKFTSIKQIHGDEHPFVRMYGTRVNGQRAFDLAKMVRDNFDFRDSKACWQLQLADMLASAWVNALRDHNNTRGYLPIFRLLHRNTVHPNDQPVGMMGAADVSSETYAPAIFNVYRRLITKEGKILPCRWEEL